MKRIVLGLSACLLAAVFLVSLGADVMAAEEKFPSKQVNWITHGGAGGGSDIFSRMAALRLRRVLKVPIVVTNMTGGSGARALNYVLSQPADGYTLYTLVGTSLATIARGMTKAKISDLTGIARGCYDPNSLCVATDGPFKTIQDAVKFGGANPKKLKFGIAVMGSPDQVTVYDFCKAAGIEPEYIPFKGGGGTVLAMLNKTVHIGVLNACEFMGQYEAGKIKPVVYLVSQRLKEFPDVPTAKELGWDVEQATWRGVVCRAGTPEPRLDIVSNALMESMKHRIYQDYLKSNLMGPESIMGRKEWDAYFKKDYPIWEKAMKELGFVKK